MTDQPESRGMLFPLFPVATIKSEKTKDDTPKEDKPSWLKNISFKTSDAIIIHDIHNKQLEHVDEDGEAVSIQHETIAAHLSHSDHESISSESDDEYLRKSKKRKKEKHKHKKHKKKHKKQSCDTEESLESSIRRAKDAKMTKKQEVETFSFRIDRKADPDNYTFQSVYRMSIVKHYTVGYSCLGLKPGQHLVFHNTSKKKQKVKKDSGRFFDKKHWPKKFPGKHLEADTFEYESSKPLAPPPSFGNPHIYNPPMGETQEFMSLGFGRESDSPAVKQELSYANPLGIYNKNVEMFAQGKDLPPKKAEPDNDLTKLDAIGTHEQYVMQNSEKFNKRLREKPNNVDLWLEFIRFQDETVSTNSSIEHSKEDHDRKKKYSEMLVFSVKESIFEKALTKNPGNIELKLAQLEYCQDYWEADQVADEWAQLLFTHTNNPDVWRGYLGHLQTKFATYSVTAMTSAYGKCLRRLNEIRQGHLKSHKSLPGTTEAMMDIFDELAQRLFLAGHMERSVAMYQALLEFNLHLPTVLQTVLHLEKLEFFDAFWESPVARIGEDGAQGWAQWVNSKGEAPPVVPMVTQAYDETIEEALLGENDGKTQTEMWLSLEASRSTRHWLPWRPDHVAGVDEDDCEDPERIVSSDHVKPCLFHLENQKQSFEMLCKFLQLLGVPTGLLNKYIVNSRQAFDGIYKTSSLLKSCADGDVKYHKRKEFVANVFKQCIPAFKGKKQTDLLLLHLTYCEDMIRPEIEGLAGKELKTKLKEFRKLIRDILKEEPYRSNLHVWHWFGCLERRFGSEESARKTFQTTLLSMPGNVLKMDDDPMRRSVSCKMHRSLAELELGMGAEKSQDSKDCSTCRIGNVPNTRACLCVLIALAEGVPAVAQQMPSTIPPTKILKCRRNLQSCLNPLIQSYLDNSQDYDSSAVPFLHDMLCDLCSCFALFEYCVSGITEANGVYTSTLSKLRTTIASRTCEQRTNDTATIDKDSTRTNNVQLFTDISVAQVHLLCFHIQTHIASLSILRGPLVSALETCPESPELLRVYVNTQAQCNPTGLVRRQLASLCHSRPHSPAVWLYALLADIRRAERSQGEQVFTTTPGWVSAAGQETGIVHQVRAWLERALSQPALQQCVFFWRIYMHLELKQHNEEAAKAVYYRGLQKCPWAKCLYVDLIKAYPEQLKEGTDLLTEKELRLRTPLEEMELLLNSRPGEDSASE